MCLGWPKEERNHVCWVGTRKAFLEGGMLRSRWGAVPCGDHDMSKCGACSGHSSSLGLPILHICVGPAENETDRWAEDGLGKTLGTRHFEEVWAVFFGLHMTCYLHEKESYTQIQPSFQIRFHLSKDRFTFEPVVSFPIKFQKSLKGNPKGLVFLPFRGIILKPAIRLSQSKFIDPKSKYPPPTPAKVFMIGLNVGKK